MSESAVNKIPLLVEAQAQKHVTVNEALALIDILLSGAVETASLPAQPSSPPPDGSAYILPPGKTGPDWGIYADHAVAYRRNGAWFEIKPRAGLRFWVKDANVLRVFDGSAWVAV